MSQQIGHAEGMEPCAESHRAARMYLRLFGNRRKRTRGGRSGLLVLAGRKLTLVSPLANATHNRACQLGRLGTSWPSARPVRGVCPPLNEGRKAVAGCRWRRVAAIHRAFGNPEREQGALLGELGDVSGHREAWRSRTDRVPKRGKQARAVLGQTHYRLTSPCAGGGARSLREVVARRHGCRRNGHGRLRIQRRSARLEAVGISVLSVGFKTLPGWLEIS